jgi:hypothetical protein
VITPLLFYAVVKDTKASFLFRRPRWARLEPIRADLSEPEPLTAPAPRLVAAE